MIVRNKTFKIFAQNNIKPSKTKNNLRVNFFSNRDELFS